MRREVRGAIFRSMTFKTYVGITLLNGVLFVGGFLAGIAYKDHAVVHAQEPTFEDISPALSAGAAAFGTVLAGRVATDRIIVNGFDLMKMQEGILNVIGDGNPLIQSQLRNVVNASKVSPIPRMKPPEPPKAPEPKKDAK